MGNALEATQSNMKPVKELLDLPSELIEQILDHLNLEGRLAFGLSCQRFGKILNETPRLWQNVSLDVDEVIKAGEEREVVLHRKYSKLTWDFTETPLSLLAHEIIAGFKPIKAIASGVKALDLKYVGCAELFMKEIDLITFCLKSFVSLTHLDIDGRKTIDRQWEKINVSPSGHQRNFPIDFHSLEYLSIPVDLLDFLFHHRFLKISSCKLTTFKAVKPYFPNISSSWKQAILELVKRQEGLKHFYLNSDYGFLFDEKVELKSQLSIFYGATMADFMFNVPLLSKAQQDRMVDFLTSQTELQRVEFRYKGESSQKMLEYRMKIFDLPQQPHELKIRDQEEEADDRSSGSNNFTVEELRQLPHHVVNTSIADFSLNVRRLGNSDDWISDFVLRFPNLRQLKIDGYAGSLQRFSELVNLESLHIGSHYYSIQDHPSFNNLNLPKLIKFKFSPGGLSAVGVNDMRLFLARHTQLQYLECNRISMELVRFAVENLTGMEMMRINGRVFILDDEGGFLRDIRSLIETHSRLGFKLELADIFFEKTLSGEVLTSEIMENARQADQP